MGLRNICITWRTGDNWNLLWRNTQGCWVRLVQRLPAAFLGRNGNISAGFKENFRVFWHRVCVAANSAHDHLNAKCVPYQMCGVIICFIPSKNISVMMSEATVSSNQLQQTLSEYSPLFMKQISMDLKNNNISHSRGNCLGNSEIEKKKTPIK